MFSRKIFTWLEEDHGLSLADPASMHLARPSQRQWPVKGSATRVSVNRLKRYKRPVDTLARLGAGAVKGCEIVWKGLLAQEQETRPFPGLW